jgi:replication factor C subunit 1
MSLIDSKVKAAFTRTYNKESHMNPFCAVAVKKLKASKVDAEGEEYDEVMDEGDDDEQEDEITADSMIKVKKKSAAASSKPAAAAAVKRAANSSETAKPTKRSKKS